MRAYSWLLLFALTSVAQAQTPYIPPDLYSESYKESYALIPNLGQVMDLNGVPDTSVKAYTEGSLPQLFMLSGSRMCIAWHTVDTLETTLDTLWSLGVAPYGSTANNSVVPVKISIKESFQNFYLPQCPNGITEVYGYNRVVYEDLFPFIDMHVYSGPRGWKFAFVIRPGGDPAKLRLKFSGQDSLGVDNWGFLKVVLADKWIKLPEAVGYQVDANYNITPLNWTADYTTSGNTGTVGFEVDAYDTTRALVLQIGVPPFGGGGIETYGTCWSTYWGGQAENEIHVIATDKDANLYAAGETTSAFLTFPGNEYGTQNFSGTTPMVLSKIKPNHATAWTSYYGANTLSQAVVDIEPDGNGNIYMVGRCGFSFLLPVVGQPHPLDPEFDWVNEANGFATRFRTTDGVLLWSTLFNTILDAALDLEDKQLVVVGYTTNCPLFEPAVQPFGSTYYPHSGGDQTEGYVAKFELNGALKWSTHVGGTGFDQAWGIAAGHGQIAVALRTQSTDIPLLTPSGSNAYAQSYGGGTYDAYLYRFTDAGLHEWGTYYGGSELEWIHNAGAVDLDPDNGDIAITGTTTSPDLPIEPGPGWYIGSLGNINTNGSFVARFSGQNDELLWSSYIRSDDAPSYSGMRSTQVCFGSNSSLFISGWADSDQFLWLSAPNLYFSNTLLGQRDGFIIWLDHLHNVRWSTLFGGAEQNFEDWIGSLAYDKINQTLYAAGSTRANFAAGEFFPLTDPGVPAYFRAIAVEPEDSYLSAFCIDYFPTSNADVLDKSEVEFRLLDNGHLACSGLRAGTHGIVVVDAQGRTVLSDLITTTGGDFRHVLELPVLATGTYSVSAAGVTGRILIVR